MASKHSLFPLEQLFVGDIEVQSESSCRITSDKILFKTSSWILSFDRRLHFIDGKCTIHDVKTKRKTSFKLVGEMTPFSEFYAEEISEFLTETGKNNLAGLTKQEIFKIQKIRLNKLQQKLNIL